MKLYRLFALTLFIFFYHVKVNAQINALALKSGCRIVSAPASYGPKTTEGAVVKDWSQEAIIDELQEKGWCSATPNTFPMVFVFELIEEYNIEKISFNNNCQKEYPGICAKEIKIESSTTSAQSGFKEIGDVKLEAYSKKYYPIKVKARWIKVTILSNYGNASYTELMDIEAWGKPVAVGSLNLIGQYNSTYGSVCLTRNANNYLYGCYESGTGEISSIKIDNRTISYNWHEVATALKGWAVVTANADGSVMMGVWGYNEDYNNMSLWEYKKFSMVVRPCSNDFAMQNVKPDGSTEDNKNYLKAEDAPVVKQDEKKELKVQPQISSSDVDFDPSALGKNYLLIIAINDYKYWNKLSNAKKDAYDVKEVLTSKYRFDKANVFEIYDQDATEANIFAKIAEVKKQISATDNLLIYFSGHGYYNAEIEEGFWIPVDAKRGVETEYMPNSTLLKYIKSISAKHIFLVADACFSGSLLSQTSRGYVENVEQYKSRWALTSGRLEFVSDGDAGVNSPFASYFIKFLRENKKVKVPVTELIQYVKISVSNNSDQTPMGSPMKNVGDEGGEFVFYLK